MEMNSKAVLRFLDPESEASLAGVSVPRKALFLDRDGVINVDHGYVRTPEQSDWVPGIFELARAGCAAGFLPVVVTNQAGIARGYYDEAEFLAYTRWMHRVFALEKAPLLATFYCPHHPSAGTGELLRECNCRKPNPGMLLAAADAFAINLASSALVGDRDTDIQAAKAAGVTHAYKLSGANLGAALNWFNDLPAEGGSA